MTSQLGDNVDKKHELLDDTFIINYLQANVHRNFCILKQRRFYL